VECSFQASKAVARLYIDEGSGATSSVDFTVTYQGEKEKERIVFYSVSSPSISNIRCLEDKLILVRNEPSNQELELSTAWIEADLVKAPLKFYKTRLTSFEYANQIKDWPMILLPTSTP
jgi:hypothetical protein